MVLCCGSLGYLFDEVSVAVLHVNCCIVSLILLCGGKPLPNYVYATKVGVNGCLVEKNYIHFAMVPLCSIVSLTWEKYMPKIVC